MRDTWYFGERKRFAHSCGISQQYLNDIIHGRKRALPELAAEMERVAAEYGLALTRMDVMYPNESKSPLITVTK